MSIIVKELKNSRKKRIYGMFLFLACLITIGSIGAYAVISSQIISYGAMIQKEVTIGDKTYTKDNPMKILEIVPHECLDEAGYMSGIEQGAVKWSDICKLPDDTAEQINTKRDVRNKWYGVVRGINGNNTFAIYVSRQKSNGELEWVEFSQANGTNGTAAFSEQEFDLAKIKYSYADKSGKWNEYTYEDENGNTVYTDNVFAYSVFDNADICDKLQVTIMAANDERLTSELVDEQDLVYVSAGGRLGEMTKSLYQAMHEASKGLNNQLSKEYADVSGIGGGQSQNNFALNNIDLNAEVAFQIMYNSVYKKSSIILDGNIRSSISTDNGAEVNYNNFNIGKLYSFICGIERDTLIEEYLDHYNSETARWEGTRGSIDPATLDLYFFKTTDYWNNKRDPQVPADWNANGGGHQIFVYTPYNWGINETHVSASNIALPFVDDNIFVHNGDNVMGNGYTNGSSVAHNIDGSVNTDVINMYGDYSSDMVDNDKLIRFILGHYKEYKEVKKINVLEIDPAGLSKYYDEGSSDWTKEENAKKIAEYFGVRFKAGNYRDKVSITTISMNGFIAMTDDIKANYDLVIVTDYNPDNYLKVGDNSSFTANGMVYNSIGKSMEIKVTKDSNTDKATVALSGDDLTEKALDNILEYIGSGKPIVLGKTIYNGGARDSVVSSIKDIENYKTNVYKLSAAYLQSGQLNGVKYSLDNVLSEPDEGNTSYKKLTYKFAPEITLDEQYSYDRITTGTTSGLIDVQASNIYNADELSSFVLKGRINSRENAAYSLKFYFDKDGNGLFTEESDDAEKSEKFYDGTVTTLELDDELKKEGHVSGEFELPITLPEETRGYVRFKAVVSEVGSNITTEAQGSIVVRSTKTDQIEVLQIIPNDKQDSNLDLTSDDFTELFRETTSLTGWELHVTRLSVKQFEAKYKNITYKSGEDYFTSKNQLGDYRMVILGFDDDFGATDISNTSALNNLYDYIDYGNSVLFTHDTMIYSAYSDELVTNEDGNSDGNDYFGKSTSYNLTSKLRAIVGMDRYGITEDSTADKKKYSSEEKKYWKLKQGFTNMFVMRYHNSSKKYLMYDGMSSSDDTLRISRTVNRLNSGQITDYPYLIDETISVADTHPQWFQLDLDYQDESNKNDNSEDIAVWYTLGYGSSRDSSYYKYAGQDALNNYYIYSKGNITYSGAGHSEIKSQGSEMKLFVNTIIKAIEAGNNPPEVTVDNAVLISEGTTSKQYEQHVRSDDPDAGGNISIQDFTVDFTAWDIDMGLSKGVFPSGLLFWDKNCNGEYDSDADVIIEQYDGGNTDTHDNLYNLEQKSINIMDIINSNGTGMSNTDKRDMAAALNDNMLYIGLSARDDKSSGTAVVHIIYRDLFYMN